MAKKRSFARVSLVVAFAFFGVALVGCGSSGGKEKGSAAAAGGAIPAGMVEYSGPDKILASDAASKTVTVNLVAGEGSAAGGFNFNGYANGDMQVQVPTGWTVKVSYIVESSLPHSTLIAPWDERKAGSLSAAFTGSAAADFRSGIEKGDDPQTFSFTADKAGQYAIVCGVPGHDSAGMWDEFDVIDNLAAPRTLVKK
jgi:sulfocyanin